MKRYRVTRIGSFLSEKAYEAGLGDIRVLAEASGVDDQTLRRICMGNASMPATIAKIGLALGLNDDDKAKLMRLARHGQGGASAEAVEVMDAVAIMGSQAALAREARLKQSTISEIVTGVRVPRPSTMRKIREAVAA